MSLTPNEAVDLLRQRLAPLEAEALDLADAAGRIVAQPIHADRDSPPCDTSAMDGYALRLADVSRTSIHVAGESAAGRPPLELPRGGAIRVFTGAPVPVGAEVVVRREDLDELREAIRLRIPPGDVSAGDNIRHRGENLRAGEVVIDPGCIVTPSVAGAMAAFGVSRPSVHRRVRVGVLVSGDELVQAPEPARQWQIRDSNGPGLRAMLGAPWINVVRVGRVADDLPATTDAVRQMLADVDALLLTGGVSVGDRDHVPEAIASAGGQIVFHRLPIRPGKPVLGALGPRGQLIVGLPGNPVSALVTARRLAMPLLFRLAGRAESGGADAAVRVANPDDRTLQLHWFRLVRRISAAEVRLVGDHGSGDLVASARADGFIEIPPGAGGAGPYDFFRWSIA